MKIIGLFILLSLGILHSQDRNIEISQTGQRPSIYTIGTGVSLSYFNGNMGIGIDSLHLFHSPYRPFDKALLKVGMGVDYDFNSNPSFNFSTSIGYLYVQNQYHPKSLLSQFGTGFSIDYTLINTKGHAIGASLYVALNRYLLGVGGGVVFERASVFPYVGTSFALTF
ncbi:MAG: hypothetical protein ACRCR9_05640 [Chitinophagaceae bacterium]